MACEKKIIKHYIKIFISFFITYIWIKPIFILFRGRKYLIMRFITEKIEDPNDYPMYELKAKDTLSIPFDRNLCSSQEKIGIVIQGPLVKKDEMTLNTIKLYRFSYPKADVILSTWEDEDENYLDLCKKEGAIIVQSKKPLNNGILNVNFQIVSSFAGIKKAVELGNHYIAKTRSDQRVCRPYVFYSLINLIRNYPIEDNHSELEGRLITIPVNHNCMFTPFFMSDFFYFGIASDMLKLFSLELDKRSEQGLKKGFTRYDIASDKAAPEIYILKNYMEKFTGSDCNCTVHDYWECIKQYLICVDQMMLDLYITKYNHSHDLSLTIGERFYDDSKERKLTMKWGFVEWQNLINNNILYKEEYEQEMNCKF